MADAVAAVVAAGGLLVAVVVAVVVSKAAKRLRRCQLRAASTCAVSISSNKLVGKMTSARGTPRLTQYRVEEVVEDDDEELPIVWTSPTATKSCNISSSTADEGVIIMVGTTGCPVVGGFNVVGTPPTGRAVTGGCDVAIFVVVSTMGGRLYSI